MTKKKRRSARTICFGRDNRITDRFDLATLILIVDLSILERVEKGVAVFCIGQYFTRSIFVSESIDRSVCRYDIQNWCLYCALSSTGINRVNYREPYAFTFYKNEEIARIHKIDTSLAMFPSISAPKPRIRSRQPHLYRMCTVGSGCV